MKLRRRETESLILFQPEGTVDLLSLESMRTTLIKAFEAARSGKKEIRVDLSKLIEFDTPFLQLLLSAKQTARKMELKFRLLNHPEVVLKNITLLGCVAALGDPVRITTEDRSKYVLKYGLRRTESHAD